MLISTSQFCRLVDLSKDRFEQRRIRERAAADLASVIESDRAGTMPIAPSEKGARLSFDFLDCLRMRAVIELERAGMSFGAACDFIRAAGVTAYVTHPAASDFFAAKWLQPGGIVHQVAGAKFEIERAMPAAPLASTIINVSAVAHDVGQRAYAQLGFIVRAGQFQEQAP